MTAPGMPADDAASRVSGNVVLAQDPAGSSLGTATQTFDPPAGRAGQHRLDFTRVETDEQLGVR